VKLRMLSFGLIMALWMLFTPMAWAQPSVEWEVPFDAAGDDSPRRIARDAQGNLYVLSQSHNNDSYLDIVVVKFDANGGSLWTRTYNGEFNGDDYAFDMEVDAAGNVYIAGMTQTGLNYEDADHVTLKYDTDGELKWAKIYDGPLHALDAAYDLALDTAGNVVVAGTTRGVSVVFGVEYPGDEYLTLKYDSEGNLLWNRRYAGPVRQGGQATAITTDAQNNIYVSGGAIAYRDNAAGYDIVTLKYDADGALVWRAQYESLSSYVIEPTFGLMGPVDQIVTDTQGNIYVLGTTSWESSDPLYDLDVVVLKYNNAGELQWKQVWGTRGEDDARNLVIDADGNVYVAADATPFNPQGWADYLDAAVVAFDANGAKRWEWVFNGPDSGEDGNTWVMLDGEGRPHAGFTTQTFESYDMALIRFGANGSAEWLYRYDSPLGSDDVFYHGISDGANGFLLALDTWGFETVDLLTVKMRTTGGVASPPVLEVTLNPAQISPNYEVSTVEGTITLSAPAPPGGTVVNLTSDNTAAVVQPMAIVAAGQTTTTFTVNANGVDTTTVATITAQGGDGEASATLTITAASLIELLLLDEEVVGGVEDAYWQASTFGQVTLDSFAGSEGAIVQLTTDRPDIVTIPDSLTIGPNDTYNAFAIKTVGVAEPVSVTITASYNGVTLQKVLRVLPAGLAYLYIRDASGSGFMAGGNQADATVWLDGVAPAGGAVITLVSSDSHVIPPTTVTIPAGQRSLDFKIDTLPVAEQVDVTVTASYRGKAIEYGLTLRPPWIRTLTLNPEAVVGGASSEGTVTLDGTAPEGGQVVSLFSDNPAATVPESVMVPAGARTANFSITTMAVSPGVKVRITGQATTVAHAFLAVAAPGEIPDTVTIQSVGYTSSSRRRNRLNVRATSTSPLATLRVYDTATNTLIGTLNHSGNGEFYGSLYVTPKPTNITVRSTLGGSASAPVP
jgi:hypothetical protein